MLNLYKYIYRFKNYKHLNFNIYLWFYNEECFGKLIKYITISVSTWKLITIIDWIWWMNYIINQYYMIVYKFETLEFSNSLDTYTILNLNIFN